MTNLDDLVDRANRLAEVESENTILRARCESAEKELAGEKRSGERGCAAYIELKSRVSALEAALLKYGSHKVGCELYYEAGGRCNCGFDTALRGEEK